VEGNARTPRAGLVPSVGSVGDTYDVVPEARNLRVVPEARNLRVVPEARNLRVVPEARNLRDVPEARNLRDALAETINGLYKAEVCYRLSETFRRRKRQVQ